MATKTTAPGLEPIDRLEEKIKLLVNTIAALKADRTRTGEENARLHKEVETLKARVADGETASAETLTMREERDLIRARVSEMLHQLDGLNL